MSRHRLAPSRPGRRLLVASVAAATVAVPALSFVAQPAVAAVGNNHSIIVFPERDFVHGDGWKKGDKLTVEAIRNGVVVGVATNVPTSDDPKTPTFDGLFDLNHAVGDPCWTNVTPDILPGDLIRVTDQNGGVDETLTANVVVTQPATDMTGGTVVMKGTAAQPDGSQYPAGQIEARLIANKQLFDTGKRDIRVLPVYDSPTSTSWTATWTDLDAHDVTMAVGDAANGIAPSESRILWLGPIPGASTAPLGSPPESTIDEYGATGGNATSGCTSAPVARYAVTNATPNVLNLANNGSDLTLSGSAQDATAVSVALTDSTGHTTTVPAVVSPSSGTQTWTAAIPAADLTSFADGSLTAAGSYTVVSDPVTGATTVITGTTKTIVKDTVAPGAPTADPVPDMYGSAQSVSLSNVDGAAMFYTVNGTPATAASTKYVDPIAVTANRTIRAISVDTAGNPSSESSLGYTIVGTPATPTEIVATRGNGSIQVSWPEVVSTGGVPLDYYSVQAFTAAGAPTTEQKVTTPSATISGLTNGTAYVVHVTAVNPRHSSVAGLSSSVTPATTPDAPLLTTVKVAAPTTGATTTSASVAWTLAGTGGLPMVAFDVDVLGPTGAVQKTVHTVSSARSASITGLVPGVRNSFRVRVSNDVGPSPYSALSATVASAPVVSRTTGAVAGAVGGTVTATIKWAAPKLNGGAPILSYQVRALRMSSTGTVLSVRNFTAAAGARSLAPNLVTAGNYRFEVRAVNAIGQGTVSARSNQVAGR